MASEPNNPFDTGDDMNPFGSSDPIDQYNPFSQEDSTVSSNTPSESKQKLSFDDSQFDYYEPPTDLLTNNNEISSSEKDLPPQRSKSNETLHEENIQLEDEEYTEEEEEKKSYSFFQLGFYQKLFDVSTLNVFDRIFRSILPFRKNFFKAIENNPDMYGPLWISITLVFVMAASGNFATYLAYLIGGKKDDWAYDFNKLPYGAAVILLYVSIIPLIYWGVLAWIDDFGIKLVQMYCLYGYAMFIYIPAGMISAIPYVIVKWPTVSIAFVISSVHLILSIWPKLSVRKGVALITLTIFILLHLGLALSFVLYFFKYPNPKDIPSIPTPVAPQTFINNY